MKDNVMKFCVPPSQLPHCIGQVSSVRLLSRSSFSNYRSIIATQRAFQTRICIRPSGRVPDRIAIVTCANTFRVSVSVNAREPGGQRTATTPENVERVREAFLHSPHRSARKLEFRRTVWYEYPTKNCNFILIYKLSVAQELSVNDFPAR
jgi:hypothetical protein